jgi:Asp-tRNA(Asn)/Glu-tRNA(Gln) amidotransferase A subunit family amidase
MTLHTDAARREGLALLTLRDAARGIRDGAFTAEALAASCIERTRALEASVGAWAWFDEERALARGRAADRALREGNPAGPLHGVGIGLKDIIDAQGIPTEAGSPIFAGRVARRSAACVDKLESAGAFVLGKTTTCEFANQHPPRTANPWNPQFTPGGSSSGSAAAVAAGFAPAAIGSQTRGSTIRPAAYCGVVGFKPSFGRLSRFGMLESSGTLDHVGLFTRSLDDAWLLTHLLQGPDERDPATQERAAWRGGAEPIASSPHPPRLAAVRTPAWNRADAAQQSLFEANCSALREEGARVEDVELPDAFAAADDATRTIQIAEIARNFAALYDSDKDRMSATFRALVERGARVATREYERALDVRSALRQALAVFLARYDAIVTPPATGEPPRTLATTGDASFCVIWTLAGVPSVAFPTALGPQGLPMGLQVVGAHGKDREVLEVASWCRARLPFDLRPPSQFQGA